MFLDWTASTFRLLIEHVDNHICQSETERIASRPQNWEERSKYRTEFLFWNQFRDRITYSNIL